MRQTLESEEQKFIEHFTPKEEIQNKEIKKRMMRKVCVAGSLILPIKCHTAKRDLMRSRQLIVVRLQTRLVIVGIKGDEDTDADPSEGAD